MHLFLKIHMLIARIPKIMHINAWVIMNVKWKKNHLSIIPSYSFSFKLVDN